MGAVLVHGLVAAALFGWAFVVFDAARPRVGFHGDEATRIATSRYLGYLADPGRKEWGRSHVTLTQPPGSRYVTGAALMLQGYDLETLNHPYDWGSDVEENRRRGRVPSDAVLMDAREASVLLAAGAVALLYAVALQLGAPLAGVVAARLVIGSPYATVHLVPAMSEAPLAFFLLATLALCLATFRGRGLGFTVRSGVLAGVTLGAGLVVKLTAALGGPALAAASLAVALATRTKDEGRTMRDMRRPTVWLATVLVTSWGVFVALNPFLWPDPVGRTIAMFENRRAEMARQQRHRPTAAIRDPFERPRLVLGHALVNKTWANTTLGIPLDVPFAALGLVGLVTAARGDWQRNRRIGPATCFLFWLLSFGAGVTWAYGLDWDRYIMPLFLLAALLCGYGVRTLGLLVPCSWRVIPRIRSHLPPLGSTGGSRSAPESSSS